MAFSKLNQGIDNQSDQRLLSFTTCREGKNVEQRPSQEGLFPTGTFVPAGSVTPTSGAQDVVGLIFAHFDATGGWLICNYGRSLAEVPAATTGMAGSLVGLFGNSQLSDDTLEFVVTPKTLSSVMLDDKLYVITGSALSTGNDQFSTGEGEQRNLVRQSDGKWRREGLDKPRNYAGVTRDIAVIVPVPSETPYTYRAKYLSASSDDQRVAGGPLVNDEEDETAMKLWVTDSGVTRRARFNFSNLAETGQSTGTQPATGKGILSILLAAGPKAAWTDIGVGGTSSYSLDADILLEYSIDGGSNWITIVERKAPFLSTWFTVDKSDTTLTLSSLDVRISVTKNSGSENATAFCGVIRFDVGGGNKAAVNTELDDPDGIHYLVTCYSDPHFGGSNRRSAPCPFGSSFIFPTSSPLTDGTVVTTTYPNGIKQITFTLPPGENQDPGATHYEIYRTPAATKARILKRYGLIDTVLIDRTGTQSYTDNFITWPITETPQPTLPSYFVGQNDTAETAVFYPLNEIPPVAICQCVYKGSRIFLVEGDPHVWFTHPYDWESQPGLYNIPSSSPRNDIPTAVASMQEAWFIFYRDYTRRVQGLPLILDGQYDATNYAETNETRGCCGPRAVCTINRDGDEGNSMIFVVDKLGFYVRNETQLLPWSKNIKWADPADSESFALTDSVNLRATRCVHNPKLERVEVYYRYDANHPEKYKRFDVYYNRMREDGQPVIWGPHDVEEGANTAVGYDEDDVPRSWAAHTRGQAAYITGEGHLGITGAPVARVVRTGYFALLGEPGRDGYIKFFEVYAGTPTNAGDLATTLTLSRNGYEDREAEIIIKPNQPGKKGIWAKAEFISVYITDSTGGSTGYELAEILGLGVYPHGKGDGESSGQRGNRGRVFNTTTRLRGA